MRAPHAPVAKFTLFILSVALVLCQEDEGYIAVMDYQDDAGAIDMWVIYVKWEGKTGFISVLKS